MTGLEEVLHPARLAVGFRLPGHPGQSASVPHEEGIFRRLVRRNEVLNVHLLDFEVAVRVDSCGGRPGRKHALGDGIAREADLASAYVEAAELLQYLRTRIRERKHAEGREQGERLQSCHDVSSRCRP